MDRHLSIVGMVSVAVVVMIAVEVEAFGGGPLVGGWTPIDHNDETLQKVLKFAVEEQQKKDNSLYDSRPGEIEQAMSQIVAGAKYHVTFYLEYTSCRKGEQQNIDYKACPATKRSRCYVEVWSQPWMTPSMQVLKWECGSIKPI